jgi:hypothetical protein
MSGIHLMNRDNVGGVIIKCGEPFLLFLLRPILFRRCDVVISLGGALLERTGVSIEAKEVARRYCGVSFTFARTSDGIPTNRRLTTYLRSLSRSLAMSGINLSEAGCSLWICLKTSIAGLFGSIFFAASANASCSAFNCAMPISRTFCGGRLTSSVCARKAREFFFAKSEIKCGFGKFLPFQPRCVITERVCRFAIGCLKCNAELLVFDAAHSGNEIFFQKIGGTSGDLDRKLDERFWKLFIEVCSRRDQDVWDL